ncbi:MAG: macro domain-containing protein, partial [Ruminococcus sp.]
EKNSCKSIAFCCISTGVFGFPQREAAQIAVDTVKRYKEENHSDIKVIFNVFKDSDLAIYREVLKSE